MDDRGTVTRDPILNRLRKPSNLTLSLLHRGGRRCEPYSAYRKAPEMGSFVYMARRNQAMLYEVTDTERSERSEVKLLIPPYSLMVFLPPLYNQLSNEQGK